MIIEQQDFDKIIIMIIIEYLTAGWCYLCHFNNCILFTTIKIFLIKKIKDRAEQ